MNKQEKFVCELTFGGIPVDIQWVKNSKLFQENMQKFKEGQFNNDLYELLNKKPC